MSLDKAIKHGKEHRRNYRRSARFDRTCRPGGSCGWCQGNRLRHERNVAADTALQMAYAPAELLWMRSNGWRRYNPETGDEYPMP